MILPSRFEEGQPQRETIVYQVFEYYCPEVNNRQCHERITASGQQLAIVFKKPSPNEEYNLAIQQVERENPHSPYCRVHHIKMVPFLQEIKELKKPRL